MKRNRIVSSIHEGPVLPQTLKIGLPLLAGNLLLSLYTVIDTWFVALIDPSSTELVSGITLVLPIATVFLALCTGLNLGITARVASDAGRRADHDPSPAFNAGLVLALFISGLSLAIIYPLLGPLVSLVAGPDVNQAVKANGQAFLASLLPGLCLQLLGAVFFGALRGLGRTTPVFAMYLLATLLNLALDPLLIFACSLGVAGAGLATSLAYGLAALAILVHVITKPEYGIRIGLKGVNGRLIADIGRLGSAQTLNMLAASLGFLLLNSLVASIGQAELTSFGLCGRLDGFLLVPIFGVAAANITLIGQNHGRGDRRRVKQVYSTHLRTVLVMAIAVAALYSAAAPWIFAQFSNLPEVIAGSVRQARLVSLALAGLAVEVIVTNTFQGLRKPRPVFSLVSLRLLVVSVPLAYALVHLGHAGMDGIYAAIITGQLLTGLVAWWWMRRELDGDLDLPAAKEKPQEC